MVFCDDWSHSAAPGKGANSLGSRSGLLQSVPSTEEMDLTIKALSVAAECIASAQTYLSARTHLSSPRHCNTWPFFDPSRPTNADLKSCHP
jgi:hypothetical protein